jgi:LysR family glycine cleavage system transcriptional activator
MSVHVSLIALRTFVEVASRGSMKEAAERLGVTPGAVSQQIRLVEERWGHALFDRTGRQIHLTDEGRRLLDALELPFRQIEQALVHLRHRTPRRDALVVTTAPSFASSWLVPRLGAFSEQYPHVEVRVETSVSLVDLRHEPVDVAIRHGTGAYPGLDVVQLITPLLIPIGSPRILAGRTPIRSPADCLAYPLLQDRERADWSRWFRTHGVDLHDDRAARGSAFQDDGLLIKAAASGQGLALVRDIYAEEALANGSVAVVIDRPISTPHSYFFVAKPEAIANPNVKLFRAWLIQQVESRTGRL